MTALHSYGYTPQIMMMIERVTRWEFLKDHEITDLKPQNPIAPTITMDVPSTSADPHTTRSSSDAPPSGRSSSSSSGVLRMLKSMFAWYRDTRQCQDVLLSNQRRQNKKMSISEFPLPVPPLDDDPFASLSTADTAIMEATTDDDVDGFDNEYEEEEEGEEEDEDNE
jgi:hypothetical protein